MRGSRYTVADIIGFSEGEHGWSVCEEPVSLVRVQRVDFLPLEGEVERDGRKRGETSQGARWIESPAEAAGG